MPSRWLAATLCLAVSTTAFAGPSPRHAPAAADAVEALPLEAYDLDTHTRQVPERGKPTCDESELVAYRGTSLRLQKPVRLHPAFVSRVQAFEEVVIEVATRVYGRAPSRIVHLGGYVCRRMKTWPDFLSEHALGDAIDIEGFDFAPATKAQRATAPAGLKGAFSVRVLKHWNPASSRAADALHARFLRELADALIARPDIFRVMLGPSYPGHQNHLHFDGSNFRKIDF
jgi:hypothetical protein